MVLFPAIISIAHTTIDAILVGCDTVPLRADAHVYAIVQTIEIAVQLDQLRTQNSEFLQGYLFSKLLENQLLLNLLAAALQ